MNIKPRLTIYIISCLTILFSSPNKGIWEQYDYNSGISSNYIFDVEKDEQDRIWVSTQNGITLTTMNGRKIYSILKIIIFRQKIFSSRNS